MKKYKGWEIAKLISEGKLEGRTIQKVTNSMGIACKELNVLFDVACEMVFYKNGDEGGSSFLTNGKVEFIIPQEPVTFMDCVNSDKKVRVEHKLIRSIDPKLKRSDMYIKEFNEGDFMPINFLIELLGYSLDDESIRKVMLEGKWYLEDEN